MKINIIFFMVFLYTRCSANKLSDECKGDLLKCTASTSFKGMPLLIKQVKELCSEYKKGMSCINEFKKRCLPLEKQKNAEKMTEEAESFMHLLCDDFNFQREYLSHYKCLGVVSSDWTNCDRMLGETFKEIKKYEFDHDIEEFEYLCCARNDFDTCIMKAARLKCNRNSANFIQRLSTMLASDEECNTINNSKCQSASANIPTANSNMFVMLFALYIQRIRF